MAEKEDRKKGDDKQGDDDLNDLLQENRILLQGAQVLTAFLTILPFSQGFEKVNDTEKWLYLATFMCSLTSLVLFTAPAAMHRLARPLQDRQHYKDIATRLIVVGLVPASLALAFSSQIVTSAVVGEPVSWIVAGVVAAIIGALWWVIPLTMKEDI
ncbi:MAG: DUF6328 family protein [Chloroflexia bacterium]